MCADGVFGIMFKKFSGSLCGHFLAGRGIEKTTKARLPSAPKLSSEFVAVAEVNQGYSTHQPARLILLRGFSGRPTGGGGGFTAWG